ncbi:MAG: exodeoxyribonuclease VII small subunit [Cyanobacteriota bacterium]|nr:exodeoxyribonuclease VII small subunit [Cyanobacteriota bacterium]
MKKPKQDKSIDDRESDFSGSSANSKAQNPPTWNYEATVAEIEATIEQLESGELPLEEVFEQFAIAVERLKQCDRFLARGSQHIELAIETLNEEGNP